jgi:Na+/H+ antiporter NhaD/arsenite permease-like protein
VTGALAVFAVTYLVIASRRMRQAIVVDRTAGAVIGAVAMVLVGGLPLAAALGAIDLHVLVLLFGVLAIAAYLREANFFRFMSYLVLTRMRSARSLLLGVILVAGALSALLVNDTVCVVMTPLVVAVVVEAELPPLPYLLAIASAANVGSVVSFTGNPQNVIIGAAAQGTLGFATYFLLTLPLGVACLFANWALIARLFHHDLPAGPLVDRSPPKPALDRVLCGKALAALALFAGLAIAGFALEGAAMVAAGALMLAARVPPRGVFEKVDLMLLVFFAGLFVVVEGLAHAGVIADLFDFVRPVIGRGDLAGYLAFAAITVVASNVVSNVPFVIVAVAWIPHLPDPAWGYLLLAVTSTLAGNLTLFGSVANLIVLESAGPRGEIGFWKFLKFGALITSANLAIAFVILGGEKLLGLAP